jgi:glycosyltransferase involved in cell wall biosynthesis
LKILLLIPAPLNISPGQRFRFEHYIHLKESESYEFEPRPFLSKRAWSIIHLPNHFVKKFFGILSGFIKRFFTLFSLNKYDYIYIYREASIIGPPIFEWLIAKVFKKKVIFDFDDAIWISAASEANPGVARLKCSWKVANICRMSHIVTVGNDFLANYARQYCKDVRVIPTIVNTDTQHNRLKDQEDLPLIIGWTGTYTNFYNLRKITSIVTDLKKKYNFTFLIIADKDPKFENFEYLYRKWNVNTEIDDLLQMHIGIMPLENTEIELGKCGFKAIQYMSLGIPAVVSSIGANKKIVVDQVTGYLISDNLDWYKKFELLLENIELRKQLGRNGRNFVMSNFSVDSTKMAFFSLFK